MISEFGIPTRVPKHRRAASLSSGPGAENSRAPSSFQPNSRFASTVLPERARKYPETPVCRQRCAESPRSSKRLEAEGPRRVLLRARHELNVEGPDSTAASVALHGTVVETRAVDLATGVPRQSRRPPAGGWTPRSSCAEPRACATGPRRRLLPPPIQSGSVREGAAAGSTGVWSTW